MPMIEPPAALAPLTDLLVSALVDRGGDDLSRARLFVRFHKPLAADTPYTDGVFRKGAPAKGEVSMDSALSRVIRAAVAGCRDAGTPVKALDYSFDRTPSGWQADVVVQTLADYDTLCAALQPVDDRLTTMLATLLDPQVWTKVSLERRGEDGPARLLIRRAGERIRPEVDPALVALLDEVWSVGREHGCDLGSVRVAVNGESDLHQSDVAFHYQLVHRVSTAG